MTCDLSTIRSKLIEDVEILLGQITFGNKLGFVPAWRLDDLIHAETMSLGELFGHRDYLAEYVDNHVAAGEASLNQTGKYRCHPFFWFGLAVSEEEYHYRCGRLYVIHVKHVGAERAETYRTFLQSEELMQEAYLLSLDE